MSGEQHSCSAQGGVARGVDDRMRSFNEADRDGAFDLDVVAEGAGEVDALERAHACAQTLEQQAKACRDGSLGQLQLANVGLVEDDRGYDGKKLGAVGDAAGGEDCAAAQAGGDGVDKAAAADAARRNIADDGGMKCAVGEGDIGNGTRDGAHAHADGAGLEGGPCGSGSADNAMPVTDGDFAVGAEIYERGEGGTLRDAAGDNAAENVRPNEAADAAGETNDATGGQVPGEIARREALFCEVRRLEGNVGERLDVEAREKMVHDSVADEDDFRNLTLAASCEARDKLAECGADGCGKILAVEHGANATHNVGPEGGLRVECGFDAEDVAGGEIDELRGNGGGAEIDGDAETAFGWRGGRGSGGGLCGVSENFHAPLAALEDEWRIGAGLACKSPSGGELIGSETGAIGGGDGERA